MIIPRTRVFWSISISHTVVDIFSASVPVLLTFLSGHLMALTNTQIGFAISAYQMTGALSQPFAGLLADRGGGRWLGSFGLLWVVGFQALALILATLTHQYVLLVIPLTLAALGSGAFHPVGAMHATSKTSASIGSLSLFFFMGQFGGGLGPALAGILLDSAASNNAVFTAALGPVLEGRLAETGSVVPMLFLGLIAVPCFLFMAFSLPTVRAFRTARQHAATAANGAPRQRVMVAPLLVLALVIMLRGLVNPGLAAFLPRLFQSQGWTPSEYGLITSTYWLAGAFSGLLAGYLADRLGSRMLIALSLLLSAPAVFLLGTADGVFAFVLALSIGAFSGSSHSLLVASAQRYVPSGKGFASGASLGFIFAMGAIGVLVIGAFADRFGMGGAFQIVGGITLVTGVLAFLLPADRRPEPAVVLTPEVAAEQIAMAETV